MTAQILLKKIVSSTSAAVSRKCIYDPLALSAKWSIG